MGTLPSPPLLFIHISGAGTAFIAIGRSYYDAKRSMKELEFLFDVQWKNGMVAMEEPEMIDTLIGRVVDQFRGVSGSLPLTIVMSTDNDSVNVEVTLDQ